jgi:hypothetical protein
MMKKAKIYQKEVFVLGKIRFHPHHVYSTWHDIAKKHRNPRGITYAHRYVPNQVITNVSWIDN